MQKLTCFFRIPRIVQAQLIFVSTHNSLSDGLMTNVYESKAYNVPFSMSSGFLQCCGRSPMVGENFAISFLGWKQNQS